MDFARFYRSFHCFLRSAVGVAAAAASPDDSLCLFHWRLFSFTFICQLYLKRNNNWNFFAVAYVHVNSVIVCRDVREGLCFSGLMENSIYRSRASLIKNVMILVRETDRCNVYKLSWRHDASRHSNAATSVGHVCVFTCFCQNSDSVLIRLSRLSQLSRFLDIMSDVLGACPVELCLRIIVILEKQQSLCVQCVHRLHCSRRDLWCALFGYVDKSELAKHGISSAQCFQLKFPAAAAAQLTCTCQNLAAQLLLLNSCLVLQNDEHTVSLQWPAPP